jgi:hypothetical protein
MDRLTTMIVAVTTVLAWSLATHLLPETWWGVMASMAVGVVFAYPLRDLLGMTPARYLLFGAGMIVIVPVLHAAVPMQSPVRTWGTAAILAFAAGGLALGYLRRRRRA